MSYFTRINLELDAFCPRINSILNATAPKSVPLRIRG